MAYHVLTDPRRPNRQRRLKVGWSWTGFFWWATGLPLLRRRLYWSAIAVYSGLVLALVVNLIVTALITELWGPLGLYLWLHTVGWTSLAISGMFGVRINDWGLHAFTRGGWTDEGITLTDRDRAREKKAAEHTRRKAERRAQAEQISQAISDGEDVATVAERHGVSKRRARGIASRAKVRW